jgi:CBS domain containing-hemolysin-like protein
VPNDVPIPPSLGGPELAIVAIIAFALVGAVLSALTAALNEVPEERLMAIRDEGGADGATADRLLRDRDVVRARLLSGRVLSVAGVAGFTAHLATRVFDEASVLLTVGAAALAYAIFSEVAQTLARRRANRVALPLARACRPLELLLAPLALPVLLVARATEKIAKEPEPVPTHIAEREIENIVEKREEEGALPEGQAELLMNVLEFKDTMAREVMVPRTRMVAVDVAMPFDAVVERVISEGHSRFPVYRERVDKIEGILHAKDLFQAQRQGKTSVPLLVRKNVLFVPEVQKIGLLLRTMQARHQHIAVVIDEFGGTAGIVTLEDILEEIVGEIQDEHDTEESLVTEVEPGRFLADARVSIHDLGEIMDVGLADSQERAESLGGLVVEQLGRVPLVGETLRLADIDITVKEADEKRVQRVELVRRPVSVRPSANDGTDRKSGELERNSSSDRPPSQAAASSEPDASIG